MRPELSDASAVVENGGDQDPPARGRLFDLGQCGSIHIGAHRKAHPEDACAEGGLGGADAAQPLHGYGLNRSWFRGEVIDVDTQLVNKGGFTNNIWVQMGALVILTIVVIALAAKYIW